MMMRSVCVCLLALSACQTAVPPESTQSLHEASFTRDPVATFATPRVIDDVSAELLRAAASVQTVQQRVHCENIANIDTVGYKRRVLMTETQQLVAQNASQFTVPKVIAVTPVFSIGRLEATQRSLDVAIDGDGFFSVVLADGQAGYTRDGRLTINQDGKLLVGLSGEALSIGHILLPEIAIPSDVLELFIDPRGLVSGRTAGAPNTITHFGSINIHRFVNPGGLLAGRWLWFPTERSGAPTTGYPGSKGLGLLQQGVLERSNVDLSSELMALQVLESKRSALRTVMRTYGIELP